MSYHDVSVDGDGEDGEERHGHERVPHEGKEAAQEVAMAPRALLEHRRCQGQVEAAEHQVGHRQVNDEHGRRVTDLNKRVPHKIINSALEYKAVQ